MKPVNMKFNNLQDYSTNQLVYLCVKEAKEKIDVSRLLWDIALTKARDVYPRETCYNAATLFLKAKKLDSAKTVGLLTNYFWHVLKYN